MKTIAGDSDFSKLTISERALLVGELLGDVSENVIGTGSALTAEQMEEIDRRLAMRANGEMKSYSWEEVKSWLYKELK